MRFAVSTFCLVFGQKHREMETAPALGAGDCVHSLSLRGKKNFLIWETCWQLLRRNLIQPSVKAYLHDMALSLQRTSLKVCYYFCIPFLIGTSQLTSKDENKLNISDWGPAGLVKSVLTAQLTQCLGWMLCVWSNRLSNPPRRESLCLIGCS